MSKQNVLFILTLAGLLFTFSLGVLTSRTAEAQIRVSENYFPRQSDLWNFSAEGANSWVSELGGGHLLIVQRDAQGRLPAVTAVHHRGHYVSGGYLIPCKLYREVEGEWCEWIRGPQLLSSGGSEASPLNSSKGVALQPGRYLVCFGESLTSYELLLSGYWANR